MFRSCEKIIQPGVTVSSVISLYFQAARFLHRVFDRFMFGCRLFKDWETQLVVLSQYGNVCMSQFQKKNAYFGALNSLEFSKFLPPVSNMIYIKTGLQKAMQYVCNDQSAMQQLYLITITQCNIYMITIINTFFFSFIILNLYMFLFFMQ